MRRGTQANHYQACRKDKKGLGKGKLTKKKNCAGGTIRLDSLPFDLPSDSTHCHQLWWATFKGFFPIFYAIDLRGVMLRIFHKGCRSSFFNTVTVTKDTHWVRFQGWWISYPCVSLKCIPPKKRTKRKITARLGWINSVWFVKFCSIALRFRLRFCLRD